MTARRITSSETTLRKYRADLKLKVLCVRGKGGRGRVFVMYQVEGVTGYLYAPL